MMSFNHNQLPPNFIPGDDDIVIGKGKKYFHHKGKEREGSEDAIRVRFQPNLVLTNFHFSLYLQEMQC